VANNTLNTEALGVFQSDVIIRSAVVEGINDLRRNPWLLNYVFASLAKDNLTVDEYGYNEIERAKEWFQRTNVSVVWNVGTNDPKFPCISIALMSSQEVESEGTLSDTHYQPFEDNNWDWPVLVGPTTPTAYVYTTGLMTIDPAALAVVLAPGMVVVTKAGRQYPILEVVETNSFTITAGTVDDFGGMVIKTANPAYITELESAVFREVYTLGSHCDSEPVHLTYLHSILVFILRRYAQSLLEARGYERSTINSTDFKVEGDTAPEFLYSRYIQITGSVRQSWPKTVTMKGLSVVTAVRELDVAEPPTGTIDEVEAILNADPLDVIRR
jgi:hypothetical protein